MKNSIEDTQQKTFLLVGIGASAGGVQALKAFFEHVPVNSGMAYVVILHISPDYDSHLTSVLQTVCAIPVIKITELALVEPNHVYVVSPNGSLKMLDGYIIIEPIHTLEERRAPVDIFFRTLAESHGSAAIAVVLSGTGADGSMGLKRVKENGGVVFVQNPQEAEYSDMPRNAIATELVDEILNVGDIPEKIISYKKNIGSVSIPFSEEELKEREQSALREIFTQLRVRTGHDFSNYKKATMMRRIERRINVHALSSLADYANFLRNTHDEATALLKDLLISVTNFFRDKEAFHFLELKVIPGLLTAKPRNEAVRVWVAGCATGEEAYSLAMLFYEQMHDKNVEQRPLQIFATDIDEAAISTAREGFYTLNDVADVSTERLRRFFIPENGGYRMRKELREIVLFASHNVLKDPPFSHLDLIACRNMLIYLNQGAQNRLMGTFHFALNPGGYLFLGTSESVDGANDLYATVSKEYQIFQARHTTGRTIPAPEHSFPTAIQYKSIDGKPRAGRTSSEQENRVLDRISLADLHQRLLEQYAPPSLIINENHDVVHISENAGRFLHLVGGEPSTNILRLIKQELRPELRTALYQSLQQRANVEVKNLAVQTGSNGAEMINLHIRPVLRADDTARGFILIVFEPSQEIMPKDVVEIVPGTAEPITVQLEEELNFLKLQLRASNEQFEVQTEELKASNEELQAMNEELRSASEELETSKEELQSINEELITVNQELKIKIEEVSQSNNDFLNLINSIDIGTIFLDRNFHIKLYTPAIRDIFNLIQADIGRPLSDINSRIEYALLLKDAENVLQTLQPIEREVKTDDGRIFLMQIQPYRTAEDRIRGVVIVFVNITQRKQAEEAMSAVDERMRVIVESTKDYAIFTFNLDRCIDSWNTGAETIFGFAENEIMGKSGDILFVPEDREAGAPQDEAKKAYDTGRAENERWHIRKDGRRFYGSGVVVPIKDNAGNKTGFVKIMRDLTQQKKAEEDLRKSEENLRLAIEAGNIGTCDWNYPANEMRWNELRFHMYGMEPQDRLMKVEDLMKIIHPDDAAKTIEQMKTGIETTGHHTEEYRVVHPDGSIHWIMESGRVVEQQDGKPQRVISVLFDMTGQHKAQQALRESEERYRAIVSQTSVGILRADANGTLLFCNERASTMLGVSHAEATGKTIWDVTAPEYLEESKRLYQRLFNEGLPFQLEKKLVRKNGSMFWTTVSVAPIKDADGKTKSAVAVITDITGRKQAEEALRETMERFQYAVQATKDIIWEIDFTKDRVWWSSMMQTLFGYSVREVQHSIAWYQSLVHPDDRERVVNNFKQAIDDSNELWIDEFRYRKADGSYVCVANRSFIIRDAAGKAIRMIGAMQDISEQKKAEALLREGEQRLRITLEAGELAAWEWDFVNNKIIWNEKHFEILGVEPKQEAVDLDYFIQFVYAEDLPVVQSKIEEAINKTGVLQVEFRIVRKNDKQVRWMTSYGRITERHDNKPIRIAGVMYDTTERRVAEDALKSAQNSLNTALDAAQMGVWDLDLQTSVVTRSARHDQLLGYDSLQEEWNREKAKKYIVEEDKAKFDEAYRNIVPTGVFNLEARVIHNDDSISWIHYYGRVFYNEKGEPTHAAGVIFDITDRKTLEQKKDEFIGIASHELKTPVTSIKAYTEILQEQFEEAGDEQSTLYLSKLNNQVDRLTRLIRDLLDATRISEGRMVFDNLEVDINQLLHETAEDLQRTTNKHAIELQLENLPLLRGDKERLQQVFINLIANALKYSPDSNKVVVKSFVDNGNINVAIEDFGIGMSAETQGKLFERFFRSSDPNNATFPGLGLGLYISQEIAKQHKGIIKVKSERGKGSVFTVVLPVHP